MNSIVIRRAVAIGVAACLVLIGAVSTAEAGSSYRGGNVRMGGGSIGKFHTNPGGKYVYRGSGSKFHTNPGGKNVYRGWSGKYDGHHKYGNYRRYGYSAWYGLPLYSYGGGCSYLHRRAMATGSSYWWGRYRQCSGGY